MLASDAILAVVSSTILIALVFSFGLFGREKKPKDTPVVAASASVSEEKIEELKTKASRRIPRLIPKDRLEKSRRELRTLVLEKELVSAALTRLYEAEAAKEITREEREILAVKYREELKSLDGRIQKIDAFIEVGDLETLRDQLLQLVSEKIDAIEKRIERTTMNAQPLINEILSKNTVASKPETKEEKPKVEDISDLLTTPRLEQAKETPQEMPKVSEAKRKIGSQDAQVDELQKELLEALDRLEKLDVES